MSIENLAARLDALAEAGAFIAEGEFAVTVSNLEAVAAQEIFGFTDALGWGAEAFDRAETRWAPNNLDPEFEPFRLVINKPAPPDGVLRVLTNGGFAAWLERDEPLPLWQVACLDRRLRTQSRQFAPWNDRVEPVGDPPLLRSPRSLVREYSGLRLVPAELGRWLLLDVKPDLSLDNAAVKTWAAKASRALLLSLPDEYDAEAAKLRFKGPPRLDLLLPGNDDRIVEELRIEGLQALQQALSWVFEIDRETEMRHILLATEIARCGGTGDEAAQFLHSNLAAALDGAKTAYQMQLAEMSSDSLKTLTELRKSVTDETAKVAEATRQIIASVASALAVGVGLIAARIANAASPILIAIVMAIVSAYVATTIVSGVSFTFLQRKVRRAWQPRLYRFLSESDYDALVGKPTRMAETALWWSAGIGGAAVLLAGVAIFFLPSAQAASADGLPKAATASPGASHQESGSPVTSNVTRPALTNTDGTATNVNEAQGNLSENRLAR